MKKAGAIPKTITELNPDLSDSLDNFLAHIPQSKTIKQPIQLPWIESCPFCGHAPVIDDGKFMLEDDEHIIGCENKACGVQPFVAGEDIHKLAAIWNKRVRVPS